MGEDFTTAPDCTQLTAEDSRLGRVSTGTNSRDDTARFGINNAPSALSRPSQNKVGASGRIAQFVPHRLHCAAQTIQAEKCPRSASQ